MPINPDAVGTRSDTTRRTWTSKDSLIYALGVGAGQEDALAELQFTTENTKDVEQRALPTMAVVLTPPGTGGLQAIGTFNFAMLLHGEQAVTLHQPLPAEGELEGYTEIVGIYDKGKAAVVVQETRTKLVSTGEDLFTTRSAAFIRGEGGWGGDRGPSSENVIPDREPDHSVTLQTRQDQALVYRLSGDRNPLHSDPSFAAAGGFDRPILHGLCTYGFTGRALLRTLAGDDTTRFRSIYGRFSSTVLPGEALTVDMWTNDTGANFRTRVGDRVVLDQGTVEIA